jgi:hypothetical protein
LSNVEEKFEQFEKNLKTEKCVNCLHQVIVDYKIVGTDRSQKMKTSKNIFFLLSCENENVAKNYFKF